MATSSSLSSSSSRLLIRMGASNNQRRRKEEVLTIASFLSFLLVVLVVPSFLGNPTAPSVIPVASASFLLLSSSPPLLTTRSQIVRPQQQQQRAIGTSIRTTIGPTMKDTPRNTKRSLLNKRHYYSDANDQVKITSTRLDGTVISRALDADADAAETPRPPPESSSSSSPTLVDAEPSTDAVAVVDVPRTMQQALRTFFLSTEYLGPPLVALIIACLFVWRVVLAPISILMDVVPFVLMVIFWSFQEHAMHGKLLHSQFDWIGKQIHQGHHDKPYYHVSIDPAYLMLGWLISVHLILMCILPSLPMALSATLGYTCAGLFYEWAHFIVHTKVRFKPNSYWQSLKNHHIRHHLVDSNYWLGFSVPSIDDLFGTNPNPKDVVFSRRS